MLINLTNHPSSAWCSAQVLTATTEYGSIKDMQFPNIEPHWDSNIINELATRTFKLILEQKIEDGYEFSVHVMGEFNFVFALVSLLLKNNINCVASTTKRTVTLINKNIKNSNFEFVQFRKYLLP